MELAVGETVIKQGAAGLLRGLDRLDGTLTLTTQRLVFEGPAGVPGASSEVPLDLIEAAAPARVTVMGVPLSKSALGVSFTNGLDSRFATEDRTSWVDEISDAARARRRAAGT